ASGRTRALAQNGGLVISDTLVAEMDVGELGMRAFEVGQRDLPSDPGCAAAGFGYAELDTFGHLNTRTMLGPGHRVADRFADRLYDAWHPKITAPGFDIDGNLDRQEKRFQLVRAHSREDPPYGRSIVGLRAREDLQQRI